MTEHAGQIVETVLPRVPVRQWVLTLPYRLRYRLAGDHGLTRAVLNVYARVLQDFYVRSAHGLGIGGGRIGMLTVVQRFGSGMNLNVHFHTLTLDGVFTERAPGRLQFHATTPPSDEAVGAVLGAIRRRVGVASCDARSRSRVGVPRCGGRLRMVGTVEDPVAVREVLAAPRPAEPGGPDPPTGHDGVLISSA